MYSQNNRALFYWTYMTEDTYTFVKSCLHCIATESGDMIPRPSGHALHANRTNELIHIDYCYMGKAKTEKYTH